jgi:hypothetical protein
VKKAVLIALAFSTASLAAVPALAQGRDHDGDRVIVRNSGWAPQIIVRHGHHGYWDEHHRWREARFAQRNGHRGYWDHHHNWHDWNG